MKNRRDFLKRAVGAAAASAAMGTHQSQAAGRLAWPGPIGLEMYTVRDQFAKAPAETLKGVAAAGYKEIEAAAFLPMNLSVAEFKKEIAKDGLTSRMSNASQWRRCGRKGRRIIPAGVFSCP